MVFFLHLQSFVHIWHFSLSLHPHVILSDPVLQLFISNEAPPPLIGNYFFGYTTPQRVGCRDLSSKICLINICPQSFSSTGKFSSWQSLSL